MSVSLGRRIAALRKARGWTQVELAAEVGVRRDKVSLWENGHRVPSVCRFMRLAEALGVTPVALWEGPP